MKILIFNLHLNIGGVETFLTKMIPRWSKSGNSIKLILLEKNYNQELINAIQDFCEIIFLKDIFIPKKFKRIFAGSDVAFCTINQAFLWACFLLRLSGNRHCKVVLGVHQTEIFCQEFNCLQRHRKMLQRIITGQMSVKNLIFVNTASRKMHEERLGKSFDTSPLIPLFIDIGRYKFSESIVSKRIVIVSIGRIVKYKTYNFTMIDVIKELLEKGFNVEWRVYGDGDQLPDLISKIKDYQLHNNVKIFGSIDYSKFQSVLNDAFVYVGSGTSLIEASACGIPSLSTIEESTEPITYGFIGEIEGNNLIEHGLNIPIYRLADKISYLIKTNNAEYKKIKLACYKKSLEFSSESIPEQYLSSFNDADFCTNYYDVGVPTMLNYYFFGFLSRYIKI